MNWSAVAAVAELLGAAAVVLSLLYLSAQVRAGNRQAKHDATRDLAARVSEISLAIASSRDLAVVFDIGAASFDQLDRADQVRYRTLCNALFRTVEQQFLLRKEGAARHGSQVVI